MSNPTPKLTAEITEKQRRIYYQSIVYDICNAIDAQRGSHLVCGTVTSPSRKVQEAVAHVLTLRLKAFEEVAEKAKQIAEHDPCETIRVAFARFAVELRALAKEKPDAEEQADE